MNFDTVRAWKDEAYRQSLSDEQINALPANPAGELELSSADLESVNGGVLLPNGGGILPTELGQSGSGAANSLAENRRFHSLSVENCNERVFSVTAIHGFNFLSPDNVFCINDED